MHPAAWRPGLGRASLRAATFQGWLAQQWSHGVSSFTDPASGWTRKGIFRSIAQACSFVTSQFEELFAISLAMAFMMMMLFSCFRLFILGQYYVDRDERRDRSRASGDAGYRDTGLSWRQPMGGHGEQAIGQSPCWKNELAFRELPSTVIQVLIAMPSAYALTGLQP